MVKLVQILIFLAIFPTLVIFFYVQLFEFCQLQMQLFNPTNQNSPTSDNFLIEARRDRKHQKKILFTTQVHGGSNMFPGLAEANHTCPSCAFTQDQAEWNRSDAVFFNGRFLDLTPPFRPQGQIWIYYQHEPPSRMEEVEKRSLKAYRNMFNWTCTYRRDSDIFYPYGSVLGKINSSPVFDREIALQRFKQKNRMIAWIVSNCKTPSKREELVAELAKHVPVDIYGQCGNYKCSIGRKKSSGLDCRLEISKVYKFYLSFESSLCEDYITEKFFQTLPTDMVPIVYGGGNYTELGFPAQSFINVADFETVAELADYILELNRHPEQYLKYLENKHVGLTKMAGHTQASTWCAICEKLHKDTRSYEDVYEWWSTSRHGGPACFSTNKYRIMQNSRSN